MKKSISILFVVLMLFSVVLAGCSKSSGPKSDLEGTTWKMTGGEASGIQVSAEDMGMTDFVIEFKANGKASATAAGESSKGTFVDKGDEVILKMDGDEMTLKVDGEKLAMDQDGTTLYFEKQ